MSGASVRSRILNYLNNNPPASSRELALYLTVTQSDVRYHLKSLLRSGKVELATSSIPPAMSPGRPARRFCIPLRAHPNNLPLFSTLLLRSFIKAHSDLHSAHQTLAELLSSTFPSVQGSISRRITSVIPQLEHLNYQPSWEARAQGPCIIYKNCPYAEIWQAFPDLCSMDHLLLEKLIGHPVDKIKNIDPSNPQATTCVFQVKLSEIRRQP